MVTVKIKENSNQAKLLLEYMKSLSFVEFIDTNVKRVSKTKKENLLKDIEKGLREVKSIQDGSLKSLSTQDLWDEK